MRKVTSFGHSSHAFSKAAIATSKSRFLYASFPFVFSASASSFAFFSAMASSSSSSGSSILTSSAGGAVADGGGLDVEVEADADADAVVWGADEDADALEVAFDAYSGGTSSPENPCISIPIRTPRTEIMRGSLKALPARAGFCCIMRS